MPSYDVNLQVRVRDVYASGEDVAAINTRADIADALGEHLVGGFEVEPDEVLQTPADVLRQAAAKINEQRRRLEAVASSSRDAAYVAAYEDIEQDLRRWADEEEKPAPQPTAVEVPSDPFAAAHDAANGPTAQWDFQA